MEVYGLIGRKLGHSYSVPIHKGLGNEAYRLFELEPDELEGFIKNPNLRAINVTIPYKLDVMKYLDVIDTIALEIGAVNTIVRRDGKLYGYNTDHIGFCRMLEYGKIDVTGKKVLVLGNGGASKTAVLCCKRLGASSVTVISRSGEDNYTNLDRHSDAEIIVNCTPVGMYPNSLQAPVDLKDFPKCEGVADMIYNPLRTALMMQAEKLGIKNVCGLIMLTAQGVAAHEYFFDTKVDKKVAEELAEMLRRESENIVLIGMPGSGKSDIGKKLGELCGRETVEIDDLIAKAAGKSIPEVFAQDGEEEFRRIETEVLTREGAGKGRIIMTGGGAVTKERNYPPLHQNGKIYEITRDLDKLALDGRPLSKDKETLVKMYQVRKPMYEAFRDMRIENNGTLEQAAELIWRDFCENIGY